MKTFARLLCQCSLMSVILLMACEQTPDPPKKFIDVRIYNAATRDAEFSHVNALDKSNLSKELIDAVNARLEELGDIKAALEVNPNIILNISRCLPGGPRVPPLPCPVREELSTGVPIGSQIELDLAGVFLDIPDNPAARTAVESASAQLLTSDGKKVFAEGSLNSYDKLFHTAWFHFDVKNATLAKKPLMLRLKTTIITNQQPQSVVIEIPIPASTFLADNFY